MNNNNNIARTYKHFYLQLVKFFGLFLLIYVCSIENLAVINEIITYFSDEGDDTAPSISPGLSAGDLFFAFINALPLALAMLDYNARNQSDVDAEKLTIASSPLETPETKLTCKQITKDASKIIFIGCPSALLAVAGFFELINRDDANPWQFGLAIISGIAAAAGYYRLMNGDAAASENCIELFRKLPDVKKCSARSVSMGIIAGNLSQNSLSAYVFLNMIDKKGTAIKYSSILILALLSSGFICNTEIRSFLQHENNHLPAQNSVTKYLLILPAALEGLFNSVGAAKIFKLSSPEISLPLRAAIFTTITVLLAYPNAKGFYYTTLAASINAENKIKNLWKNCRCSFFVKKSPEAVNLLGEDHDIAPRESVSRAFSA